MVSSTTSKPLNYYGIVLDESGSMHPTRSDTIGSLQSFHSEQQKEAHPASRFVVHTFNNDTQLRFNKYICDDISSMKYIPSGGTALYDAIQTAISHAETTISSMSEKPLTTTIIILTDGEENASRECSVNTVKRLFSKYKELGWQFIFLGANQDAVTSGTAMGLDRGACLSFNQTPNAQYSAMRSVSNAVNRVNHIRSVNPSCETQCMFTDEERYDSIQLD